jgi:hypothetical protein
VQIPPPRVADVLVDATTWTPAYLGALATAELGNGSGYAIPVGSAVQLQTLPWRCNPAGAVSQSRRKQTQLILANPGHEKWVEPEAASVGRGS